MNNLPSPVGNSIRARKPSLFGHVSITQRQRLNIGLRRLAVSLWVLPEMLSLSDVITGSVLMTAMSGAGSAAEPLTRQEAASVSFFTVHCLWRFFSSIYQCIYVCADPSEYIHMNIDHKKEENYLGLT